MEIEESLMPGVSQLPLPPHLSADRKPYNQLAFFADAFASGFNRSVMHLRMVSYLRLLVLPWFLQIL
jgi:hypothetical protein